MKMNFANILFLLLIFEMHSNTKHSNKMIIKMHQHAKRKQDLISNKLATDNQKTKPQESNLKQLLETITKPDKQTERKSTKKWFGVACGIFAGVTGCLSAGYYYWQYLRKIRGETNEIQQIVNTDQYQCDIRKILSQHGLEENVKYNITGGYIMLYFRKKQSTNVGVTVLKLKQDFHTCPTVQNMIDMYVCKIKNFHYTRNQAVQIARTMAFLKILTVNQERIVESSEDTKDLQKSKIIEKLILDKTVF